MEAVVDSGAQVSVLSRKFYDSLSCRPKPVESIRLKGASASGVMVGCRVDGVEVDLGDGHGNYSMTMYVANITDNCILGFDYLKARKAVIDLSQGVLVVNDTIVKESISTQKLPQSGLKKLDWLTTVIFFQIQ